MPAPSNLHRPEVEHRSGQATPGERPTLLRLHCPSHALGRVEASGFSVRDSSRLLGAYRGAALVSKLIGPSANDPGRETQAPIDLLGTEPLDRGTQTNEPVEQPCGTLERLRSPTPERLSSELAW